MKKLFGGNTTNSFLHNSADGKQKPTSKTGPGRTFEQKAGYLTAEEPLSPPFSPTESPLSPGSKSLVGAYVENAYPNTPVASLYAGKVLSTDYFPAKPHSMSTEYSKTLNPSTQTSFPRSPSSGALQNYFPTVMSANTSMLSQSISNTQQTDFNKGRMHSVEQHELNKSVKCLENVLVTLEEYQDLKSRLAKAEKKLAKGSHELSKLKAYEEVPSQTLLASARIFDQLHEVSSKQAKVVQREYETLNDHSARYFKKIAKEERNHEEQLETLESKIKKAHAQHDKNARKSGPKAIESHDKYIANVQALTSDVQRSKTEYSCSVGSKTYISSLFAASAIGSVADSEYKSLCERVRKSGPHIGKLNEWLNFSSTEGMSKMQPLDINDKGMGWAQVLATKEAEIQKEMQRVEEAKLAQLEQVHTMWKAQAMGWTPPTKGRKEHNDAHTENREDNVESNIQMESASLSTLNNEDKVIVSGKTFHQDSSNGESSQIDASNSETMVVQDKSSNMSDVSESNEYMRRAPIESPVQFLRSSSAAESKKTTESNSQTAQCMDKKELLKVTEHRNLSATTNESVEKSSDITPDLTPSGSEVQTLEGTQELLRTSSKSTGPLTPKEENKATSTDATMLPPRDTRENHKPLSRDQYIPVERPFERYTDSYPQNTVRQQISDTEHKHEQQTLPSMQRSEKLNEEHHIQGYKDRESELEQRLAEAENRLRVRDAIRERQYNDDTKQPCGMDRSWKSDLSYGNEKFNNTFHSQAKDQYSSGVSRSLSTDSERSFVARMKAKYQEDKQQASAKRHGELQSGERIPTASRRVSDMANAYAADKPRYGAQPLTGIHDQYPTNQRNRYDSAPTKLSQDEQARRNNFGRPILDSIRIESTPDTLSPHSKGCGCWNCSGRHYGNTGGQAKSPGNDISLTVAQSKSIPSSPHAKPPFTSSASTQNINTYRRQSLPLQAVDVQHRPHGAPMREFTRSGIEDEGSERRVAFAREPQAVR